MNQRQNKSNDTKPPAGRPNLLMHIGGNTLAIMAIALVPVSALAGSAVDTARLYVVKVRLQQACDAGALAGRKYMLSDGNANLDINASKQATTFFRNNIHDGWLQIKQTAFTPSKTADQQVTGTASAVVPMSLMKMFGSPDVTLTVNCQARYDVADTDVMFVLDTTGSMACSPSDPDSCGQPQVTYIRPSDGTTGYNIQEKSNSRISALRSAVLSFYDTVAGSADPSTHIRYGFVPYTSTVNAGAAITSQSPGYMVQSWSYQSRKLLGDATNGGTSNSTVNDSAVGCSSRAGRSPASGYTSNGSAVVTTVSWTATNGGTCTVTSQPVKPNWRYGQWPFDVSQYVLGASVIDPSKVTGAKSKWQGCIEERDTVPSATFDPKNLPTDLDPDLVPSSDNTRWRPMWSDVLYYRPSTSTVDDSGNLNNPYGDSNSNFWFSNPAYPYLPGGYMTCGKAVQRLTTMSRSDVSNYVNDPEFVPWGGTYHDTGMIWGTRMISPNGIFASDTAAWPGRNAPNRYIVFMTDGHMATNQYIYGMYGWENYDQRTTGGSFSNSDSYHNARFLAECQAAKDRGIKVFVVSVAAALDSNLTTCASPGQAFFASDSAALTTAFQNIAKQVAKLRISQ